MTVEEAKWIRKSLERFSAEELSPMLNLGSASTAYRTIEHPHIDRDLLKPLRERNVQIVHTDLVDQEGVDIVGDLGNAEFVKSLKARKFKSIICASILMYIEKPQDLIKLLLDILPKDGILVISDPHVYPYTAHPIDYMHRLSPEELFKLTDGAQLMESSVVESEHSLVSAMMVNPKFMATIMLRMVTPFYKPVAWWKLITYLPNAFKKYSVSCIILKKNGT